MITTTPAIDPQTVETVLVALLDPEATLPAVARASGMTVDALLELLETPEMQAKLERLQRVLDQRARLLAISAETAALGALSAQMSEIRQTEAEHTRLTSAREAALASDDPAAAKRAEDSLAQLEARFRKRTETARSARATLTHARSRERMHARTQPASELANDARRPARSR
jgi:hypothetical protein